MATKFIIVGLATDGPSNIVTSPRDERDLRFLYGGGFIDRIFVSPATSGCTLLYEPWTMPINEVNGSKKAYLYSPYIDYNDGRVIYFGNLGGTGLHQIDFTYTPYTGEKDLIFASRKFLADTNRVPYMVRLGGDKAELDIEGWEFESKYAGTKYNRVSVTSTGSSLVISGLEPNFPTNAYPYTTPGDMRELIERDYHGGISPLICVRPGSAIITSGTYYLSGGTDGSFSDDDVENFLTHATLPIDATHILFISPLTSGMIDKISDYMQDDQVQPRMFFIPAPTYAASASTWIEDQLTNIPYRHNMVASFIGEVETDLDGRETTRYTAEAAAIGFAKREGYNLTNVPVNANSFTPVLSESELIEVKNAGWIPLMRYIKNDISIYEGVTTYAENTFLYSSKVAEVMAIAHDYCFQFIGTIIPEGERPEIASVLQSRLSSISFLRIDSVAVTVYGDSMYVSIEGFLPGEILRISFTVKNR